MIGTTTLKTPIDRCLVSANSDGDNYAWFVTRIDLGNGYIKSCCFGQWRPALDEGFRQLFRYVDLMVGA